MNYRTLGKTGIKVSEIGFGAWAIGGSWGEVDDSESLKALKLATEKGINFIDTADVYGDGHSEQLISGLIKEKPELTIATKAGRRLSPHEAKGYNKENLEEFIDRSRQYLGVDSLDLLQLHCPPTEVYYNPEVFKALDEFVEKGKIKHYGVSVEKVEEALKAIEYPNVKTVQIIFNMFRQRPMELFFKECEKRNIGVIVRVPLASGLLTGKMSKDSTFSKDDHRNFNRNGEAFDKGETFAGVDFEKGLEAVEELKKIKPDNFTMAQFALKWILMFPAVSTVIAGAKNEKQVNDNTASSELPELDEETMDKVREIYEKYVKDDVHHIW
ncbi:MAG: aldo/keto reductase [Candidatus Woesearchaeota archaeon]